MANVTCFCYRLRRIVIVFRWPVLGPTQNEALTGLHCKDLWISVIESACQKLDINAFCISDIEILDALARATLRGVNVRLRFDKRQQDKTTACIEEDQYARINVHPVVVCTFDKNATMHKKELISCLKRRRSRQSAFDAVDREWMVVVSSKKLVHFYSASPCRRCLSPSAAEFLVFRGYLCFSLAFQRTFDL